MRRLLVVSHEHPPSPGIGGTRWVSMTRYLRRRGYDVTTVASNAWGGLPDDDASQVVRVADLRGAQALRRILRRGDLRLAGDQGTVEKPPNGLLTKVIVPEISLVAWLPAVVWTVRRLMTRETFDCLVTSSPPESSHLLGLLLGSRRPAWVADFRDGWNFEPWREPFPTRAQRKIDQKFEKRVVAKADLVVGATRPISDDFDQRLGARAAWVPNGWDPANAPAVEPLPIKERQGATRLVYTGTLSGEWGRTPEPLLRALSEVRNELGPNAPRLVHAGRISTSERELIDRLGVADLVELRGTLERAEALELQRSADALVLITSRNRSEATGKLFEYLGAGRPILALAEGNEAARIVTETGTGVTVPPEDVGAIATALRRLATHPAEDNYAPHDLERFVYPGPADAMAELIERAIEHRAAAKL